MLKSAAIILVCDMFLRGEKEPKVLKSVIRELNILNYELEKVSVIHENERNVTSELDILSKQFDIIIVIGKLDNTIFKALGNVTIQALKTNVKFKTVRSNISECNEYENTYELPVTAKLIMGSDTTYPIIQVQRIFLLKEESVEILLNTLRKHLKQYRLEAKYTKVMQVQMNENTKYILDKIKKPDVNVFYQELDNVGVITLESIDFGSIVECEDKMKNEFNNSFIESCIKGDMFNDIYTEPEELIQQALESIEKCLEEYKPDNVFLSFNGGKDCTVLLHLVCTVMNVKYSNYKGPILCLYVKSENAFPEQDKFIAQCKIYFNLELITVSLGIKEALNEILVNRPNLKACFMGTRKTDPFSSTLRIFQMTDPGWPQIMRVSPLLDWHYSDIWNYLLYYKVPYCKLYDLGYTSLGNVKNTTRNPCLQYYDIYLKKYIYLPAYKMINEDKERNGRNIS